GRLFVAEMRSYMQDIDGQNEQSPVGRVSMHWSSKGDGNFDRHTVFADHLVLPRMILPLDNGLLINQTDTEDLYLYRDTDGDGVADKVVLFYKGGPRGGNLEHQQSGLIWDQDNWIYQAVNSYRLRAHGTNVLREPTSPNGGQWGLTQDVYGLPWFVNAGGEVWPLNFQVPIAYFDLRVRGEMAPGFEAVWPLIGLADFQGGEIRVRPEDQTLNHFTATCGPDIFRGDRLPQDMRGDLFFAEPVGRLIRRAKIQVRDGVTHLSNPYDRSEFIRSRDPNFRPVNMVTAPDGTLYIVDMYRGIIQEGNWVRPGSYLRPKVEKNGLQNNFGRGRVWRLVHEDFKPGPQPHMLDEKPSELVAHLDHPNGWWRDTAQKLLVLRGDKSVVPALEAMARHDSSPLARIHAIWTLEGLDAFSLELTREKLKDSAAPVRIAAIRASETACKKGEKALEPDILAMMHDPDSGVAMQAMMTANLLKFPEAKPWIEKTLAVNNSEGVQAVGNHILNPPVRGQARTAAVQKQLKHGEVIYKELCFSCHGVDGRGAPLAGAPAGTTMAPPFAASKVVTGPGEGVIKVLLKGLTGPVNSKTYDAQMVAMESNDDAWIADVATFVRNSFGNKASVVSTNEVARVRASQKDRLEAWTTEELAESLPRPVTDRSDWKLTASHNPGSLRNAVDGNPSTRFDTSASQTPGMWVQIELPLSVTINALILDSTPSPGDYPRGYKVQVSPDGNDWSAPIAVGKGRDAITEIDFSPVTTRFIRITQTGAVDGLFWSIHELNIFQPALMSASVKRPAKRPESKFE
ncbi:MAG: coagulation factor 5/8 type domain protein, partial [Verrucomicrobiales bacterium]|nr:coagulation factor 5/8 type domain protein [Verrucomicrobiales bacterium]